jgi:GWxTD domain-containing protein
MRLDAFYLVAAVLTFDDGEKIDKKVMAERLLHETLAQTTLLSWTDRVRRLERVVAMNGRLAAAYYELARTRMENDTIENRSRAAEAIDRAVRLNPKNSDYRFTYGLLQLRRGMEASAEKEFRKALSLNPADPRPAYQLGLLAEARMFHYRDMFNVTSGGVVLDLRDFADEEFLDAQQYYETALAADPAFPETYHRLALLYYEGGKLEQMMALLQQAIRQGIGAQDHYLFLGLAYHEVGDDDAARRAYEQALLRMPTADQNLFESLQTVLPNDSMSAYRQASAVEQTDRARKFWASRDPLYLTAANERLMEHYGRVAYANLRYSFPHKKIEGWKTDRGKTLIRFGRPPRHFKTRVDLATSSTGHMQLNPSREIWDYGDFQLVFEDRFLNRNYSFSWGFYPEEDSKYIFENLIKSAPERYEYPHGGKEVALPHVIAQFRGKNDSTQVEVYYGVSEAQIQPGTVSRHAARFLIERGFFLFDTNWQPLQEKRESRVLDAPFSPSSSDDEQRFVLDRFSINTRPGDYAYALEVRDRISRHSGSSRGTVAIENFGGLSLKMSSVLLASHVSSREPPLGTGAANLSTLYTREGIDLIPVLRNQFTLSEPIYVYYEIYNLQSGMDGFCKYRIDSRIEPIVDRASGLASAWRGLGRLLGLHQQKTAITSSFESGSMSNAEKLHHAVEFAGAKPGKYSLTLRVNDLLSGQFAERTISLELVERPHDGAKLR